jgi:hypothetical protein
MAGNLPETSLALDETPKNPVAKSLFLKKSRSKVE